MRAIEKPNRSLIEVNGKNNRTPETQKPVCVCKPTIRRRRHRNIIIFTNLLAVIAVAGVSAL